MTNALGASRATGDGANVDVGAARRRVPQRLRPAQPNRVKVTVYRDAGRGNPVSTLIAQYFGIATATSPHRDRRSVAGQRDDLRAAVHDSRSLDGDRRRPPSIPTTASTSSRAARATPLRESRHLHRPGDPADLHRLQRRAGQGHDRAAEGRQRHQARAELLLSLRVPGSTGGVDYRWNIGHCNTT